MCCLDLTLSTKLIGTVGLSLSILMINLLISEFFSVNKDEEFLIALESWMLFGLNWTYVIKCLQIVSTAHKLLTCVLIYTTLSLIANALLALGAVNQNPQLTLPWLYFQMINILDQAVALGIHLTQTDRFDQTGRTAWYIPISTVYLLISIFFWMIVASARREWMMLRPTYYVGSAAGSPATGNCNQCRHHEDNHDFNLPKSPSYLSSKIVFSTDHPIPDPPPKYEVV